MGRCFKRIAPDTNQAQIALNIGEFSSEAIGNAGKTLIISAIIYVLRNYTSGDNPRSVFDIHHIVRSALGNANTPSENTVRRHVEALYLSTNGDKHFGGRDYSNRIFRKQLGGRVLKAGNKKEALYFFQSDFDERDIDIVRSFVDDERNKNSMSYGLKKQDKEYVNMLCDMFAAERKSSLELRKIDDMFEEKGAELFRGIGDLEKPKEKTFFENYHTICEAIKNNTPLAIQRKANAEKLMSGDNGEYILIPDRIIWIDNRLYVEGELNDDHDREKIRIADIISVKKTE